MTRLPAQSLYDEDAEMSVLGAMMSGAELAAELLAIVGPPHFYSEPGRIVAAAIERAVSGGESVDPRSTRQRILREGGAAKIGDAFVPGCVAAFGYAEEARVDARLVADLAERRSLRSMCLSLAEAVLNGTTPAEARAALADALEAAPVGSPRFTATDWPTLISEGAPEIGFVHEPYVPAGARVWVFGPAGVGKSIWGAAVAAEVSRAGAHVLLLSQENPRAEDLRRLERLGPDPQRLHLFHDAGFDLARAEHARDLVRIARQTGARLVVIDSFGACFGGDENSAEDVSAFDRTTLVPLRDLGVASLVLDHVGHPAAVRREGVHAGRGSSVKSQRADLVVVFRPVKGDASAFELELAKCRLGGVTQPRRRFQIVDADGTLAVEEAPGTGGATATGTDLHRRIRATLAERPGELTRSQLVGEVGARRAEGFEAIDDLMRAGRIAPAAPRSKLRLAEEGGP